MNRFFYFSYAVVILASVLYNFTYPEVDPDLWGHVFFGREIFQDGTIPLKNLYSYTAPEFPWVNHEWLSEVIFFVFYALFGSPGLITLKLVLGAITVWFLNLIMREKGISPLARTITLVWAMALLSPGFNIRPQIFTYFFFSVFLLLFYRYGEGRRRALYWIPVLLVLWVNLHGGFISGLGAFGLFCVWTVASEQQRQVPLKRTIQTLGFPFAISILCLLVNPYGFDLIRFVLGDLLLSRPITEWKPIPLLSTSFLEVKLAVLFVLFSLRGRSLRGWDVALLILTVLFAFRYQRHTPLLALAAVPFLSSGIDRMLEKLRGRIGVSILSIMLLGLALFQFYEVGTIRKDHGLELVVNPAQYPSQAVAFLIQNDVRGNLAVSFNWGEYAIWKLYPNIRVSIDGRFTTAYPMDVIDNNWEWMKGGKKWRNLIDQYPTDIALTNRRHPITQRLRADPEWAYIYSDPLAFIFVRNLPSQKRLLERFERKELTLPEFSPVHFPG